MLFNSYLEPPCTDSREEPILMRSELRTKYGEALGEAHTGTPLLQEVGAASGRQPFLLLTIAPRSMGFVERNRGTTFPGRIG